MRSPDVHAVGCNLRGWAVGQDHPGAKHPDGTVERARELHAAGARLKDIAAELGVRPSTAWHWVSGRRRNTPAVRVVVRRRAEPEQSNADAQRQPAEQATARDPGPAAPADTVSKTDIERSRATPKVGE